MKNKKGGLIITTILILLIIGVGILTYKLNQSIKEDTNIAIDKCESEGYEHLGNNLIVYSNKMAVVCYDKDTEEIVTYTIER